MAREGNRKCGPVMCLKIKHQSAIPLLFKLCPIPIKKANKNEILLYLTLIKPF